MSPDRLPLGLRTIKERMYIKNGEAYPLDHFYLAKDCLFEREKTIGPSISTDFSAQFPGKKRENLDIIPGGRPKNLIAASDIHTMQIAQVAKPTILHRMEYRR